MLKKRMLAAALCAVLLTLAGVSAAAENGGGEGEPFAEIKAVNRTVSGNAWTLDAVLTGHALSNTSVTAALYSESGKMKSAEVYSASDTVKVRFTGAGSGDYAKLMWLKDDGSPVCRALTAGFDSVQAFSPEEFAGAAAAMIRRYEGQVSTDGESGGYGSARLIVGSDGLLPDLSQFKVAQMIMDEENHYLIQFTSSGDAERCAEYLEALPGVRYAEADAKITIDVSEGELAGDSYSWGVSAIQADVFAGELRKRGLASTVTAAVVDTGVDSGHRFLMERMLPGYDFVDGDASPQDGNSHGTHVAGTIVDCTPDLNVKILPVRVLDNGGSGYQSVVGQGIRYAADHGADVINLSLGGGHSDYIDSAVSYAVGKGVTVVVAAGNDNEDTRYHCPAHIVGCITVAAVNSSKEKAYFSNYGDAVDIAAPGVSIRSSVPNGGYGYKSGTSMAAPHAAAAAALLLYENSGRTPAQIEAEIRAAAIDLGSAGWDRYYGAGFLSLEKFITKRSYTVMYDANGGTGAPPPQTEREGTALRLSASAPKKENTVTFADRDSREDRRISAAFRGWNTRADGTGTAYVPGEEYAGGTSVTLYARWEPGTIGTLPAPERDGYTFKGWYTARDGGTGVTRDTEVRGDMTVYARWEKDPGLIRVELRTPPEKTEYYKMDSLDTSGLTLNCFYDDGGKKAVTEGFVCSPKILSEAGTQTVTVEYGGLTVEYQVVVDPRIAVYTANDLANVRQDQDYILMNDIDLSEWGNWRPLHSGSSMYMNDGYAGTFDGNGHAVSNMTVSVIKSGAHAYGGLFGKLSGGTVRNLTIRNGRIYAESSFNGYNYSRAYGGAICGCATDADIIGCVNENTAVTAVATDDSYAGGIAGEAEGSCSISSCANSGRIHGAGALQITRSVYVGGIAGWARRSCTFPECTNTGEISLDGSQMAPNYENRTYKANLVGEIYDNGQGEPLN